MIKLTFNVFEFLIFCAFENLEILAKSPKCLAITHLGEWVHKKTKRSMELSLNMPKLSYKLIWTISDDTPV